MVNKVKIQINWLALFCFFFSSDCLSGDHRQRITAQETIQNLCNEKSIIAISHTVDIDNNKKYIKTSEYPIGILSDNSSYYKALECYNRIPPGSVIEYIDKYEYRSFNNPLSKGPSWAGLWYKVIANDGAIGWVLGESVWDKKEYAVEIDINTIAKANISSNSTSIAVPLSKILTIEADWSSVQNQIIFREAFFGLERTLTPLNSVFDVEFSATAGVFSDAEQTLILGELKRVFDASDEARATFLNYVSEGRKIEIVPRRGTGTGKIAGSGQPVSDSNQININLNDVNRRYLSLNGDVIQLSLGSIIYHEFLHVYDRAVGNAAPEREEIKIQEVPYSDPKFDHLGSVVRRVNVVRVDLGEEQRGSYTGLTTLGWDDPNSSIQTHIKSLGDSIGGSYDQVILFITGDDAANRQYVSTEVQMDGHGTRDLIIGLNVLNDVYSGDENDTIVGYFGEDIIGSGRGDDRVIGLGGNDIIDGGLGDLDTAVFTGEVADYNISRSADGRIEIEHARGSQLDGTDTLSGVEFAEFSNATMDLGLVSHTSTDEAIVLKCGENYNGVTFTENGNVQLNGNIIDMWANGLWGDISKSREPCPDWDVPPDKWTEWSCSTVKILQTSPLKKYTFVIHHDCDKGGVGGSIVSFDEKRVIAPRVYPVKTHYSSINPQVSSEIYWSPGDDYAVVPTVGEVQGTINVINLTSGSVAQKNIGIGYISECELLGLNKLIRWDTSHSFIYEIEVGDMPESWAPETCNSLGPDYKANRTYNVRYDIHKGQASIYSNDTSGVGTEEAKKFAAVVEEVVGPLKRSSERVGGQANMTLAGLHLKNEGSDVQTNIEDPAENARDNIRSIEAALNLYKLDNYVYPTTDQGLESLVKKPTFPEPPNWKEGGYVDRLPLDPWKQPYQYLCPGRKGAIDIYSLGPDNVSSDDDIGNWEL